MKVTNKDPHEYSGDLLVYFILENEDTMVSCPAGFLENVVSTAWKAGDFTGKKGESLLVYPSMLQYDQKPVPKAKRILLVGLGKREDGVAARREQLRLAGGTAALKGCLVKACEVMLVLPKEVELSPAEIAECLTEGLLLGNYRFDKYKEQDPEKDETGHIASFILHDGGLRSASVRRGMKRGENAARAACTARDMANEPGNGWTPAEFADYAKKLARKSPLKCKIIEKATMKKLGMGGILAVNQGSAVPPKLVILEYSTNKKNPTIMLVGKGLTFDSGGISLKPSAGMEDMKYDMCGGAAVLTAMQAIAREKPAHVNVVALVPSTDNMSGSAAIKPGDIITHFGGKTSEVINTDAEGRLILADALAYGIKTYKPDAVVDLATLTGAVIFALGHHRTGLLGNNDQLVGRILAAGEQAGEPLWRLPLGPEYSKQIKSKVADIRNIGGKPAGTITAEAYLQEFVDDDVPWAHLDIAGTAWNYTEKSYV
ncbi:MAG: leucyl aminopeptidase, partial [Desulfobulbaceae bacterium]|nr:leucyl aminopeptidase [Desulfobulbaceae bacterium]